MVNKSAKFDKDSEDAHNDLVSIMFTRSNHDTHTEGQMDPLTEQH